MTAYFNRSNITILDQGAGNRDYITETRREWGGQEEELFIQFPFLNLPASFF
jgi:hypothetical protein